MDSGSQDHTFTLADPRASRLTVRLIDNRSARDHSCSTTAETSPETGPPSGAGSLAPTVAGSTSNQSHSRSVSACWRFLSHDPGLDVSIDPSQHDASACAFLYGVVENPFRATA
jgi:hypothetical protein